MTLSRLTAIALCSLSLSLSTARAQAEPRTGRTHYPMKADEFKRLIEKRIASVKSTIDKKLERHGVSMDRRAQIRHAVDVAAGDLRSAVERAISDGVVTKEESVKVRSVADKLRGRVREELKNEKNAQKKGVGAKPPREEKPAKKKAREEKPAKTVPEPAPTDA